MKLFDRPEKKSHVPHVFMDINFLNWMLFNTSSLNDSYIVFNLKMESVSKNTIFGLKMMLKSGLEKFILKFLHAVIFITEFVILDTFTK